VVAAATDDETRQRVNQLAQEVQGLREGMALLSSRLSSQPTTQPSLPGPSATSGSDSRAAVATQEDTLPTMAELRADFEAELRDPAWGRQMSTQIEDCG